MVKSSWDQTKLHFIKLGFNLISVLPISLVVEKLGKEAIPLPVVKSCKSLILLGNGGPRFWLEFKKISSKSNHPVDDYSNSTALRLLDSAGLQKIKILYPFGERVPLGKLAELAGWSFQSPLGLGIHPRYGLWFAIRALVAVHEELPPSPIQDSSHPCNACVEKHCLTVCPAEAASNSNPFDLKTCGQFRLTQNSPCQNLCPAREACTHGKEFVYAKDQITYHASFSYQSLLKYQSGKVE